MFDVNNFVIIGRFLKIEANNLYLKIDDDKTIKFVINKGIRKQLSYFKLNNETIAIKGYISSNKRNTIMLCATKLFFLSNKH